MALGCPAELLGEEDKEEEWERRSESQGRWRSRNRRARVLARLPDGTHADDGGGRS